ncbi:MAG: hypothetical protein LBG58_11095, partial [Planctomycetaceae bacterium]|nr:hypothetical protein [Planctomycetaceae bacterium]
SLRNSETPPFLTVGKEGRAFPMQPRFQPTVTLEMLLRGGGGTFFKESSIYSVVWLYFRIFPSR